MHVSESCSVCNSVDFLRTECENMVEFMQRFPIFTYKFSRKLLQYSSGNGIAPTAKSSSAMGDFPSTGKHTSNRKNRVCVEWNFKSADIFDFFDLANLETLQKQTNPKTEQLFNRCTHIVKWSKLAPH